MCLGYRISNRKFEKPISKSHLNVLYIFDGKLLIFRAERILYVNFLVEYS